MARNERDVELVIKARDEAERALTNITDALLDLSKAQDTIGKSANNSKLSIGGLNEKLEALDTTLTGLQDLGRVVTALDKATSKITQMEVEASQARSELTRLGTEAQAAAQKTAAAEQARAANTNKAREATKALNAEVRAAKAEEKSIQTQINNTTRSLDGQVDRLERAKKAYDELQKSASKASASLGVAPNREAVQSAIAQNRNQREDAGATAQFRATAAQNDVIRQRAEYERFWAESLRTREAAMQEATQEAQQAAAAEAQLVQQAERLKGQLNPLGVAQDRYNKELAEAELLHKRGKITTEEYAKAQNMLKGRLDSAAEAMDQMSKANLKGPLGLRPYELTNLSYQVNDIVTGLMSGQPAVQILAQQGGQVFQIFARQLQGFLPRLAAMAPMLIGITAALAVLGAAVKRAFDDQGNLRTFNTELARLASGAAYSATEMQKSAVAVRNLGVDTAKTRDIFKTFVKEGLNPELFVAFTKTAKQFAKVTGQEIPDAAKLMAEGFTGGFEQIKKLDDQFDFLTAAERAHIRVLFESGRAQDARRVAFEAFSRQQDKAAKEAETVWSKAAKTLGEAWRGFVDLVASSYAVKAIKGLIDLLGEGALKAAEFAKEMVSLTARFTDYIGLTTNATGRSSPLLPTAPSTGGRAAGGGAITKDGGITPDIDAIIRTVIGEARRGDVQGMQDVAAVILNRMERSGKTAQDVVFQRGQFEPWGNPRTKGMLQAIKPTDAVYQDALKAILPILRAEKADPTGGATLFVAPKAQNELGRRMPAWADPKNMTVERGGHQFFTGAFPGDKGLKTQAAASPNSDVALDTEARTKGGQDAVALAERQLAVERDLSREKYIQFEGAKALKDAQDAGYDSASANRLKEIAEEKARAEVERDRAARMREIRSEQASANREAGRQQDTLARQMADIDEQTQAAIDKRRAEAARNPGARGELAQMEIELRQNGEILKQRTELEFREKEINALLDQREMSLKRLKDQYDAAVMGGTADPQKYLADVGKVLDQFNPRLAEMAGSAKKFVEGIGKAVPPERTQKFVDEMNTIVGGSSAETRAAQQLVLNNAEKAYNDLLTARNAKLAELQQRLQATNPEEYLKQSRAVIAEFAPGLASAAASAAKLAEDIGGAKPSPELQAILANAGTAAGESDAQLQANSREELALSEQRLNEALAVRAAKLAEINALLEAGKITKTQADAQEIAAYAATQPLIDKYLAARRAILQTMLQTGVINQQVYDAEIAKLGQIVTETERVDQRALSVKQSLEQAFSGSAMNAFDTFARGLAEGKGAIESLGDAMRQFAADFLSQMAKMIMQQIIFNALQAMSGGAGGGGIFSSLSKFITGTNHTGGMAGSGPKRAVSPGWFGSAFRYHSGGIAGLKPNEVPSILERGEEVLTRDDPRHRMNGGMGGGGSQPVTVINTFDPAEFISKALGVPEGEKAILNFMRVNSRAVKSALG
jgi:hypothetical protein